MTDWWVERLVLLGDWPPLPLALLGDAGTGGALLPAAEIARGSFQGAATRVADHVWRIEGIVALIEVRESATSNDPLPPARRR